MSKAKEEEKSTTPAAVNIRTVPRKLRTEFRKLCLGAETDMSEAIVQFMSIAVLSKNIRPWEANATD